MTTTREESRLFSVPQFAATLGVTTACIRRWLLERKIACVKVGRLVRIPASQLDRIMEEGFRPAKAQSRSGVSHAD